MIIDTAKYSCPGGHEINEDSCLTLPESGIFIVADGLGGHTDGEKASMAAIDYFERSCRGNYTDEEIARLLEEANIEVLNNGDGGKTTVAAAFTENGRFIYANVGDSRVYYFRGGKIIAATKDHSVCQASVDMGMMRPEDIRGNEDRSRLLKVLGAEKVLNIKKRYQPIEVQNGDAFLICSDGFWEYVFETEMEMDLLKSDSAEVWLKYMLKRHILRAENKGDNYTAICGIIHLEEGEAPITPGVVRISGSAPDAPRKKSLLLPLIIATAAIAAAAACLVFFLAKGESSDSSDSTQSSYSTAEPSNISAIESSSSTSSEPTSSTSSESSSSTSSEPTSSTPPESSSSTVSEPTSSTSSESSSATVSEPSEPPTSDNTSEPTTSEAQSTSEISEPSTESETGEAPSEQSTAETPSVPETASETDDATESQESD
ncbi:MAG: protein phosphatase 2C domain-containing protein [Oscillospiraceae bacterium]|nr:protein phosphatase 2C domain-containing protein [Oscillospiraceae bacterium]